MTIAAYERAFSVPDAGNVRKGIPFDQIVSLMRQRRTQQSTLINGMIDIRDRYNGDVILPMSDVDGKGFMDPPVPRLIAQAIDGTARRAASPNPTIVVPALKDTLEAMRRAETRRKVIYSRWHHTKMQLKLYRSYRHLVGYGTCAFVVLPDEEGHASIEIRDPLTAYPELRAADDVRPPRNVGFVFGRSITWIVNHYPEANAFFYNAAARNWDTLWDMVEWIDEDEIVVGILGPRMPAYGPQDARPYGYNGFELRRRKNKAGCVPVAMPQRLTLDRVMGQMTTMISTVDLHARLTALMVVDAEKHTFPDMVVLSEPNQTAQLTSGQWKAGTTGEVNIVSGARGVEYLVANVAPFIPGVLEGLESGIRETGGASSMFGGEGSGGFNPRTGQAINAMGSFAIDPQVEEAQKLMAATLGCLNECTLATEKGYSPRKKFFSFTGLPGDERMVTYTPAEDFDSLENSVTYPIPGADISQMSVAIAQMVSSNLMSKRTGRVKHPLIDTPGFEESNIAEESILAAVLASVTQQASTGALPLIDLARILELVSAGTPVNKAVQTAHDESQNRQAATAQPPGPTQSASPTAQPGLSMPGTGVETQPGTIPAIPPGSPSLKDFHTIIRNLNSTPSAVPTGGPPGA